MINKLREYVDMYNKINLNMGFSELLAIEDFIDFVEIQGAWKKGLPKEAGNYWLYTYRYGKISCGNPTKPEMVFLTVRKKSNIFLYTADGNFLFKSEIEEPYYMEVELPKPPYGG